MNKIKATITTLNEYQDKIKKLFESSKIDIIKQQSENDNRTTTIQINDLDSRSDIRLEDVLKHLRQHEISYSYIWHEHYGNQSGETHYRSNGLATQHLSWMDYEKNVVSIEDVRQAVTQGDTAVLDLLDVTENQFTPWEWNQIA